MSANFRKIDVDIYDEDVLLDEELYDPDPRDPAQVLEDTKQRAAAVRNALSRYGANVFIVHISVQVLC